jgi:DNA-binding CsgD family transcriptional regulator
MLRMREEPDAIFTARGRVEHATGDARQPGPLEDLRHAVSAIEHARSTAGRSAPDEAVKQWRGLVSARWSLVEQFDTDGKRYILARANEPASTRARGLEMLTTRERQVVAHLMLGHSMKLIAYELGIAYSTVRVLTMRACAKLGVNGREELLAAIAKSTREWVNRSYRKYWAWRRELRTRWASRPAPASATRPDAARLSRREQAWKEAPRSGSRRSGSRRSGSRRSGSPLAGSAGPA